MATRADTITQTSKTLQVYSDFADNFIAHPVTNDLVVLKNQDSVSQALKNMIMTNPGERLFNPFFGSGITASMFELYTPFLVEDIIRKVNMSIKLFETRATLLNIAITESPTNDGFNVNIVYSLINIPTPINLSLFISRVR
jgi:phage baseplate assembly protein W